MTFPYTGWVLTPSCAIKQEKFVKDYNDSGWHETDRGRHVHITDIYPSKEAAIQAGEQRLLGQQADIDLKQTNLNKRRAALAKAAGEVKP